MGRTVNLKNKRVLDISDSEELLDRIFQNGEEPDMVLKVESVDDDVETRIEYYVIGNELFTVSSNEMRDGDIVLMDLDEVRDKETYLEREVDKFIEREESESRFDVSGDLVIEHVSGYKSDQVPVRISR